MVFKMTRFGSLFSSLFCLPGYIQVESTTKCNLRCRSCIRPQERGSDISLDLYNSIIEQMVGLRRKRRTINLTGLGEPLLNPNIVSMVKHAKERGFRVGFFSNLTLMDEEMSVGLIDARIDYVQASFDSVCKETFEKMRLGADFDRIVENVKRLVETRNQRAMPYDTRITLFSTVSEENVEEIPKIIELGKSLGVDAVFFGRAHGSRIENPLSPARWKNFLEIKTGTKALEQGDPQCIRGVYVTFDGKVLPCGHFIEMVSREEYSRFAFGDLNSDSLSNIWFSNRYRQFRTRVILGGKCTYCPECCPVYEVRFR